MNKDQIQKLKVAINKIVEARVKEELKAILPYLKKQIVTEIKQSQGLVAKRSKGEEYFQENYGNQRNTKPKLNVGNTTLNSIFENTDPLDDDSGDYYEQPVVRSANGNRINLITTDPDGHVINQSDPKNKRLMEVFGMNFSEKMEELGVVAETRQQKVKPKSTAAIAAILGNTDPIVDDDGDDFTNESW